MAARTPLPTLLSQALVAHIIELDNEFEHRMPHSTTEHGRSPGARRGVWLTSDAISTLTAQPSPLMAGLEPYPDGWRAAVRPPATLPHYPMVLHRGGFPDGS